MPKANRREARILRAKSKPLGNLASRDLRITLLPITTFLNIINNFMATIE